MQLINSLNLPIPWCKVDSTQTIIKSTDEIYINYDFVKIELWTQSLTYNTMKTTKIVMVIA